MIRDPMSLNKPEAFFDDGRPYHTDLAVSQIWFSVSILIMHENKLRRGFANFGFEEETCVSCDWRTECKPHPTGKGCSTIPPLCAYNVEAHE